MGGALGRRDLLRAAAGAGLAGLLPTSVLEALLAGCAAPSHRVLDQHQTRVIEEAAARLVPGPHDDPGEAGHPGAREADVVGYITTLLGAFTWGTPKVFAGGPFSGRAGHGSDDLAEFLPLRADLDANWRRRLAGLHRAYVEGIAALDRAAGRHGAAGFAGLAPEAMDSVLSTNPKVASLPAGYDGFTDLLFDHVIEGMYSVPEYGGNAGRSGWSDIGFPGDVQPRGYTAAQVSGPLSTTALEPSPPVAKVLALLAAVSPPPPAGL